MDLPKSAHAILADAVAKVLDPPLIDQTPTYVAELEMALHNYRLANNTALETPFGRIIRGAILAIENGAPQDAVKYLNTLLLAGDFTPLVDLDQVTARPSGAAERMAKFEPSHVHADGGRYQLIDHAPGKCEDDGHLVSWTPGVVYRGEDGMLRWTTAVRWSQRFQPLTVLHA
jgi:hypothetical protein